MSLDRTSSQTADARRIADGAGPTGARTTARFAWSIVGLSAVFEGLFVFLLILNSAHPKVDTYDYWLADVIMAVIFPAVGALIVSRYPGNALGWLFCVAGLFIATGGFAGEYAAYTLIVEPGLLPGGVAAAWAGSFVSEIGFFPLVVLIPLLFPDGRPPSRGWWAIVWLAAGGFAMVVVSRAFMPGPFEDFPSVMNPMGIEGAGAVLELLPRLGGLVFLPCLLASYASLIVRFRRSRGEERQQLKWFTFAAVLIPLSLLGNTLFPDLAWLIGGASVAFMPVAIGIAVLKYRLYDIDIVVNRTIVYGALTASVVGLYVLVVGGLGVLLQARGNLLVSILATGLVAVLFQPLRSRLQRGVDRLMYGERDDPYRVLSRLGQRLEATLTPDATLRTVVEITAQALKLPYAAITLKQAGEEFVAAAEYGTPAGEPVVLPLAYGAEPVGQLILAPRSPGEAFSPSDKRLLDDLARQAGVAVHAARLTADVQRSRERLVTAREEERRRLRRDLHDGLGPRLAAQTLKVGSARMLYAHDPAAADTLLAELEADMEAALTDVRRLVYDLRPPALDELGLVGAIRETAARYDANGLSVSVDAPGRLPSLPAAVEVAVYRIVGEALANVVRHARARSCAVRLSAGDGELGLEVSDDGVGIPAGGARTLGVGLHSMRERAEELGGSCRIEASAMGGTRVVARLPLPESGDRPQDRA